MAATSTTTNPTVSKLFQFFEDIPFGQIAAAIESGGLNVAADVTAAEALAAAVIKDFFNGASPTTAAVSAAVAVGIPEAAPSR